MHNSVIDAEDQLEILKWIKNIPVDDKVNLERQKDLLLAHGLDIDEPGPRNIHWAAINGKLELLQLLLDLGADIEAKYQEEFIPLV